MQLNRSHSMSEILKFECVSMVLAMVGLGHFRVSKVTLSPCLKLASWLTSP